MINKSNWYLVGKRREPTLPLDEVVRKDLSREVLLLSNTKTWAKSRLFGSKNTNAKKSVAGTD